VARVLLLIDIQNDYFPDGANPLEGPEAAARNAARLLQAFRAADEPVVHLQHIWADQSATYMRPETDGIEIHPMVAPVEGEPVIRKSFANGFHSTTLHDELEAAGAEHLVIAGMMTSMCVDATVRAAADLGYEVSVAHDACATMALTFDGAEVPADYVQAAFLAALAEGYARVATTGELLAVDPSLTQT
jgi:nicotinamidase-related amidase